MSEPVFILAVESGTPEVRVHANPMYALYHYLIQQGQSPIVGRNPDSLQAAEKATHVADVHTT